MSISTILLIVGSAGLMFLMFRVSYGGHEPSGDARGHILRPKDFMKHDLTDSVRYNALGPADAPGKASSPARSS